MSVVHAFVSACATMCAHRVVLPLSPVSFAFADYTVRCSTNGLMLKSAIIAIYLLQFASDVQYLDFDSVYWPNGDAYTRHTLQNARINTVIKSILIGLVNCCQNEQDRLTILL